KTPTSSQGLIQPGWQWPRPPRKCGFSFGEVMLHTIGYIYTRNVARELRKDTQYMKVHVLADWVQNIDPSQLMAASGAAAYIHKLEEGRELNQGENKIDIVKACMDKKDHMINTLWRINVIDIESTLSHVCQAVLKDPNTSDSVRELRGVRV
ncbi:chaperone protein dnaJ 10, partial [Trifolium medium]|nr:chaperone protein dnaJ 10 [Trifolium medium]